MIGTTLGHYRIVRALGSGGMAEVYAAEDSKLKREVAVKILPAHLGSDPDRRDRFEREAQAVAALNHPNIVTIYSIEHIGGVHFLTMELVEGKTLAELVPAHGMPLERLLSIGVPLAAALSAAHERGIVHRDLKPANVMMADDGRVKVLDFGLAKLREVSMPDTVTASLPRELTGEGRILGSVSYMSPEQAAGRPVDHRTDIFSLGITLYEMATGRRPFTGDTSLSVLSSIMKDTPEPVTEINRALPRDFGRIVRHSLQKDPELRYQSAKDLRNDLQQLADDLHSGELQAPAPVARPRPRRAVVGWVAAAAVTVVAGWLLWSAGREGSPITPAPAASFTPLTTGSGVETIPSLSPDGRWVVYQGNSTGNYDIYLQSVRGQNAIDLTKDSNVDDTEPAFSPDGEQIAFRSERSGGGIFTMGRTGESVRRLTDRGYNPAWSPDGKWIVFATQTWIDPDNRVGTSELWRVEIATGEAHRISAGDAVQASVSPHGSRIAYWALPTSGGSPPRLSGGNRDVWTMRVDGSDAVAVTTEAATDWNPVWSPDGTYLYFVSDRGGSMNLWRVPIDEGSGRRLGPFESITTPSESLGHVTRSADGTRFAYASNVFAANVQRNAFNTGTGRVEGAAMAVTTGTVSWRNAEPSPDGTTVVFWSSRRQEDIYIAARDGSGLRQITNDAARDRGPRWSPDGTRIAFTSNRAGDYGFWIVNPDGSGLRELVRPAGGRTVFWPLWSPDGTRIAASDLSQFRNYIYPVQQTVVTEPLDTLPPPPIPTQPFFAWSWSRDGTRIAGTHAGGVWVYSLESRTYQRVADGVEPRWLGDSRRLVYANRGRLYLVDTRRNQIDEILAMPGAMLASPAPSRDDRDLYFMYSTPAADIWLLTFKQ